MKKAFVLIICILTLGFLSATAQILSPEETFGFPMGTDRRLIDWNQIHAYFTGLDESPRIQVRELGKTTRGRPFIMAIVSSEDNLDNLGRYREIQRRLAAPYGLDGDAADPLIREGRVVVLISMNIHSTEIASSQLSVELAHELAFREDDQAQKVRENVILLLIPSLNPDGLQMVTEWYRRYAGTEYEGCRMPWLYHPYAGHDNNRDWFMFNLQESRLTAPVLYHEWHPEIVYDMHQMGSGGPRLFFPPYSDPVNINVDPALMAEVNRLGKHVIADMHRQGFKGVTSGMRFNAFFQGTMSKTPLWHNMIGILSEMASVRVASPLYFPRGSLGRYGDERPRFARVTDFLDPWEGGWWRLRDIVEYEKAAAWSVLDLAATYKDAYLTQFYTLNREAIRRGGEEPPYAYIIPGQHDPNSASEMLKRLHYNGIRIFRADTGFQYDGKTYPAGTIVIPLAQPVRACIKDLMEPQTYPNLMEYPGGPPRPPYDFTGWTLPLQMGVRTIECRLPLDVPLTETFDWTLHSVPVPEKEGKAIVMERRFSHSYVLINRCFEKGIPVYWSDGPLNVDGKYLEAGSFVVPGSQKVLDLLGPLSEARQVPLHVSRETLSISGGRIQPVRLGVYQPWTASMDEGWTRWVLDHFEFEYRVLHNEDILKGALKNLDVLLIPSMPASAIIQGNSRGRGPGPGVPAVPPPYDQGLGTRGVQIIRDFVRQGGTLITIDQSCDFAIDELNLPVVNTTRDLKREDYFVPGSLLRMELDLSHPIARGMPPHAAVRFINSPAFRLLPYTREVRAAGYFDDRDLLMSGWLIGQDHLAGKTVLADIPVDSGRVILFGFGVQSRAQTFGTFRLLFNAVYEGGSLTSDDSIAVN